MADWRRVKALFEELIEFPADQRRAALERASAGEADLRAEVEALLDAHDRAGAFLDAPTLDASAVGAASDVEWRPGERVGAYELLEVIGEGGFGTVYRARQEEPVRREVALKVIKPGMDTREVIARFAGERQALSLMDHPSIARVLDAGTTATGRPYFVMELVPGEPITAYCNARRCGLRDRLELMTRVCHAVQHAHQKGVIHRDLKPGNVLVAEQDGVPTPKVIDFGISKALHGRIEGGATMTRAGAPIGTPAYMSPEQADGAAGDVDTRADIYSLGVLLYELLTGTPPFDLRTLANRNYDEVRRIIRQQDPPRPSTRVLALLSSAAREVPSGGESAPAATQCPCADPRALVRSLRGDLDWIIMKCLEKDRARRYASASELALELQRYLGNEPISARPPTLRYRVAKFARRNRAAFAAITGIAAALTLGLAASVAGYIAAVSARGVADEQRRLANVSAGIAQRAARKAEAVNAFLQEMLSAADPKISARREITVRESLDRALARLDAGALHDQADVEAAVRLTIGRTYAALAQFAPAEREIEAAVALTLRACGSDSLDYASALQERGVIRKLTARPAEAEPDMRRALEIARAKRAPDDPILAAYMNDLALTLADLNRTDDAERLLRDALAIARLPRNAGESVLGEVLNNLGSLRLAVRDWPAAEPWFREALEVNRRRFGTVHPNIATNLDNLAQTRVGQQDLEGGEALYREALEIRRKLFADPHPEVATTLHNLATVRYLRGDLRSCEALLRESLDIFRGVFGLAHLDTLTVVDSLVSVMSDSPPRFPEIESLLREAFDATRDAPTISAARRSLIARRLAELYNAWGKPAQAQEWQSREQGLLASSTGPATPP